MTRDMFPNFFDVADEVRILSFLSDNRMGNVESLNPRDKHVFILENWLSRPDITQHTRTNICNYILLFMDIYYNALLKDSTLTYDVLFSYWRGTADNPEWEGASGFYEALSHRRDSQKAFNTFLEDDKKDIFMFKSVINKSLTTYSKLVEYVGKILIPCINLVKIASDKQVNLSPYTKEYATLYNKIESFNELSKNNYTSLTSNINRSIRNAESHLNIKYVIGKGILEYKTNNGTTETITIEEWFTNIYPEVSWIHESFIYSFILLLTPSFSKNKFIKIYNDILDHAILKPNSEFSHANKIPY